MFNTAITDDDGDVSKKAFYGISCADVSHSQLKASASHVCGDPESTDAHPRIPENV